jgi:hypothetical protein
MMFRHPVLVMHPVMVMLAAGTTAAAPFGAAVALPFRWLGRRMTKNSTHTSAAPPLDSPWMPHRLSNWKGKFNALRMLFLLVVVVVLVFVVVASLGVRASCMHLRLLLEKWKETGQLVIC